jgi:hypothetical protein
MNQSVIVFSNSAARSAAITSPVDGMLTYLEDTDVYESYTAGAWVTVADGTGWTTFTPSWYSGLTEGNGTYSYAKFKTVGKTIDIQIRFIFGSTSAMVGDLQLETPVAMSRTTLNQPVLGSCILKDNSVNTWVPAIPIPSSSTRQRVIFRAQNASGTYVTLTTLSSTLPFTWAVNDEIQLALTYEVD